MATKTLGTASLQKQVLSNPTYWLILVALVIVIVVGYSARTTSRGRVSAETPRVPALDIRAREPTDRQSVFPLIDLGFPTQERSKNSLNQIDEPGSANPKNKLEPDSKN